MIRLCLFIAFLLLAQNCLSQKIIQEKLYDSIPQIRSVLKKDNGYYLILTTSSKRKKYEKPVNRENRRELHSRFHIFTTNANDSITLQISSPYKKNEFNQMLINSKDKGFILIKSIIDRSGEKDRKSLFAQKFNEFFEEEWIKEVPNTQIFPQLKDGISHENGNYTLLFSTLFKFQEIIHFDKHGNKLWNTTIEDTITSLSSILATKNDDFLLVGYKDTPCEECCFDYEYLAIKMDSRGKVLWSNSYKGPGSSRATVALETKQGNFIIGGATHSTEGEYKNIHNPMDSPGSVEVGILKIDKEGNLIWNKSYGGYNTDRCGDLLLTKDGRIIVLASTESNDGDVYKSNGGKDVWMLQLNSNGELIWEETYGGKYGDAGLKMEIDENNIITIFGLQEVASKHKIPWEIKIDDSFDISKPETHGIERRKHLIKDLESIKNETDVDKFIKYMFPYTYGWGGDSYLKDMDSVQWFVKDFNKDGKKDLLVYGIDQQEEQSVYTILSKTDDTYDRNIIIYGNDKKYIFKVDSTKEDIKIILKANPKKEEDIPGFEYPKVEDIDTLVYKYGAFINYNETPINTKQIEYIQLSFSGHHVIGATIKVFPNGKVKAYRPNYKSENRELVLIKEWKISKEEQNTIFNLSAELKFPDPNESKKTFLLLPHNWMYLSLQMKSGEKLSFPNNAYFPSKTIDRISEICGEFYNIANTQMMENFKENR